MVHFQGIKHLHTVCASGINILFGFHNIKFGFSFFFMATSDNSYTKGIENCIPRKEPKEVQLFLPMFYPPKGLCKVENRRRSNCFYLCFIVLGNVYWTFNLLAEIRLFGTLKMFYPPKHSGVQCSPQRCLPTLTLSLF